MTPATWRTRGKEGGKCRRRRGITRPKGRARRASARSGAEEDRGDRLWHLRGRNGAAPRHPPLAASAARGCCIRDGSGVPPKPRAGSVHDSPATEGRMRIFVGWAMPGQALLDASRRLCKVSRRRFKRIALMCCRTQAETVSNKDEPSQLQPRRFGQRQFSIAL